MKKNETNRLCIVLILSFDRTWYLAFFVLIGHAIGQCFFAIVKRFYRQSLLSVRTSGWALNIDDSVIIVALKPTM